MQPFTDADLSTILKADLIEAYKALRDHGDTVAPSERPPQVVAPEVTRVHLGQCAGDDVEAVRVAPYAAAWQARAGAMVLNHRSTWELEPDVHDDPERRAAFLARTRRPTLQACRDALREAGPLPGAA